MTAASAAAVTVASLDAPDTVGLAIVVLGGLVEGVALGGLQAFVLRKVLGDRAARWFWATVVVAGLGWGAASAPAAFAESSPSTAQPPVSVVLAGAAGLGLAMGAVLGAAQSLALRTCVRHPWRWAAVSAVAWTPTMVVVFVGATTPSSSWPAVAVLALGAVTGLAAGTVLASCSAPLVSLLGEPAGAS